MKKVVLFACLATTFLTTLFITGGVLLATNQPSLLSHLPVTLSNSVDLGRKGIGVCPPRGATRTRSATAEVTGAFDSDLGSTTMTVIFEYDGNCNPPNAIATCTQNSYSHWFNIFSRVRGTNCQTNLPDGTGSLATVTAEDDAIRTDGTTRTDGTQISQNLRVFITSDIYGNTFDKVYNQTA